MFGRQPRVAPLVAGYFVLLLLLQSTPARTTPQTLGTDDKHPRSTHFFAEPNTARPQRNTIKEEVLVSPLQLGRTLVHLHFTQSSPYKQHLGSFPKAVGQLAAAVPFNEVELSLTRGRWHYHWGEALVQPKPTGAELLAKFSSALGSSKLPRLWGTLSHALGGMFCASLNFVARPETTATQAIVLVCKNTSDSSAEGVKGLLTRTPQSGPAAVAEQGSAGQGAGSSCVLSPDAAGESVLYAALPQEASCTENLTPWLKLLPCRDASGLGRLLLPREQVFGAEYHSMRVLIQVRRDQLLQPISVTLTQTFTMVLLNSSSGTTVGSSRSARPTAAQMAAGVHQKLIGQHGEAAPCPVAQHSRLYVHLPACKTCSRDCGASSSSSSNRSSSSDQSDTAGAMKDSNGADIRTAAAGQYSNKQWQLGWSTPSTCLLPHSISMLKFSGCGQRQLLTVQQGHSTALQADDTDLLLAYNLATNASAEDCKAQDVASAGFAAQFAQPDSQAAVSHAERQAASSSCLPTVHRDITGSGALHGGTVLRIRLPPAAAAALPGQLGMCVLQVVPWHVRLWMHTLQLHIDGKASSLGSHLTHRHISTAADRSAPLTLHLCFSLPSSAQTVTLSVQFSKAFLTAFEHPPDAFRGFDVPAAQVSLTGLPCSVASSGQQLQQTANAEQRYPCNGSTTAGCGLSPVAHMHSDDSDAPLLRALAELTQQVYSPGLVVPLAVPDFSMPYNVICLTSTVLALFFGATLNALLLRPAQAEEDAYSDSKATAAARRRKKLKLALVILLFGGLGVYLDPTIQEALTTQLTEWGFVQPKAQASIPL